MLLIITTNYCFNNILLYVCRTKSNTVTNLHKMEIQYDIHSDIEKTFNFIDQNLPQKYSREVWNLLPKSKQYIELDYIRKVKKQRIKNAIIINALYRVAQFYHLQNRT